MYLPNTVTLDGSDTVVYTYRFGDNVPVCLCKRAIINFYYGFPLLPNLTSYISACGFKGVGALNGF